MVLSNEKVKPMRLKLPSPQCNSATSHDLQADPYSRLFERRSKRKTQQAKTRDTSTVQRTMMMITAETDLLFIMARLPSTVRHDRNTSGRAQVQVGLDKLGILKR